METLTDTLMERVDNLVHTRHAPPEWGNPLLSTTPTSLAVRELAVRTEALEKAVREIALEVQKLSASEATAGLTVSAI
jgi:predicted sugar kinase